MWVWQSFKAVIWWQQSNQGNEPLSAQRNCSQPTMPRATSPQLGCEHQRFCHTERLGASSPDTATMSPPENHALMKEEVELSSSQIYSVTHVNWNYSFSVRSNEGQKISSAKHSFSYKEQNGTTSCMGHITTTLCKDGYHSKFRSLETLFEPCKISIREQPSKAILPDTWCSSECRCTTECLGLLHEELGIPNTTKCLLKWVGTLKPCL